MRITISKIDQRLCEFSPYQILLLKSRLLLFRAGIGSSREAKSWNRIALAISTLPDHPALEATEKEHITARYRYYLLTESRRGRSKPSDKEIADGNFFISDDTLHRWFNADNENGLINSRVKNYVPSSQKLGAIRDFLVVHGFLAESELENSTPFLAPALAFSSYKAGDIDATERVSQRLDGVFSTFTHVGQTLTQIDLYLDSVESAGYTRLLLQSRDYISTKLNRRVNEAQLTGSLLKDAVSELSVIHPSRTILKFGWFSHLLEPSLLGFFEAASLNAKSLQAKLIRINSGRKRDINSISVAPISSYSSRRGKILPVEAYSQGLVLFRDALENKFDLIANNLYTETSIEPILFQLNVQPTKEMYTNDDKKSGKVLFDAVTDLLGGTLNEKLIQDCIEMINEGHNVDYWDNDLKTSTLHIAAGAGLREVLFRIMENDEIDYLKKDGNGYFPADLAFRVSDELGSLLTEKQASQAKRDNIDISRYSSDITVSLDP